MSINDLKLRTRRFALSVIEVADRLPRSRAADVIGRQLIRSGTSVGANYRAACRGRSPAEFVAKLGIVEEETDETIYGLELAVEARLLTADQAEPLLKEAGELLSITIASIKTARANASRGNLRSR